MKNIPFQQGDRLLFLIKFILPLYLCLCVSIQLSDFVCSEISTDCRIGGRALPSFLISSNEIVRLFVFAQYLHERWSVGSTIFFVC